MIFFCFVFLGGAGGGKGGQGLMARGTWEEEEERGRKIILRRSEASVPDPLISFA